MAQETQDNLFDGRLIAIPETRQLDVLADLFRARGAEVLRCPLVAIQDAPDAAPVLAWIERLIAAPPDLLVFYTGEGLERLLGFATRADRREAFLATLGKTQKLCRGPKPKRALRRLELAADIEAAAPTTAGILETLAGLDLKGRRVAVQLYGDQPIPELEEFLAAAGAEVDFVAPYVYASEADDARVVELIERLERGEVDAITFTSKSQIERLLKLAEKRGLEQALARGLAASCVAAIGPVVADTLKATGIRVDTMPSESFFMKPLVTALAEHFRNGA